MAKRKQVRKQTRKQSRKSSRKVATKAQLIKEARSIHQLGVNIMMQIGLYSMRLATLKATREAYEAEMKAAGKACSKDS